MCVGRILMASPTVERERQTIKTLRDNLASPQKRFGGSAVNKSHINIIDDRPAESLLIQTPKADLKTPRANFSKVE